MRSLSSALSRLLRLVGRDPDPAKSREHVLLSVLAHQRLTAGQPAELGALIGDLLEPPLESIGALPVDAFVSARERSNLAAALNALLEPKEERGCIARLWIPPTRDGDV